VLIAGLESLLRHGQSAIATGLYGGSADKEGQSQFKTRTLPWQMEKVSTVIRIVTVSLDV